MVSGAAVGGQCYLSPGAVKAAAVGSEVEADDERVASSADAVPLPEPISEQPGARPHRCGDDRPPAQKITITITIAVVARTRGVRLASRFAIPRLVVIVVFLADGSTALWDPLLCDSCGIVPWQQRGLVSAHHANLPVISRAIYFRPEHGMVCWAWPAVPPGEADAGTQATYLAIAALRRVLHEWLAGVEEWEWDETKGQPDTSI